MENVDITKVILDQISADEAVQSVRDQLFTYGLPGLKTDGWRFTDLAPVRKIDWTVAKEPVAATQSVSDNSTITFVNGYGLQAQSGAICTGVLLENLDKSSLLAEIDELCPTPFAKLSYVATPSVLQVTITDEYVADCLLCINFVLQGSAMHNIASFPFVRLVVNDNVKCRILLSYESEDGVTLLNCSNLGVVLGKNASCQLIEYQNFGDTTYSFANISCVQASGSRLVHGGVDLGGCIARRDVLAVLGETGAEVELYGIYLPNDSQIHDSCTRIQHKAPSCKSTQQYKGVIAGHGKAVFNGLICVEQIAQKTVALQSNKTLLLSRDATVDATPQLEIYADDVKCAHGCTVGQLDATQLFFLRSRGIHADDAKALLTYAFVNEVVRKMDCTEIEPDVMERIKSQTVSLEGC